MEFIDREKVALGALGEFILVLLLWAHPLYFWACDNLPLEVEYTPSLTDAIWFVLQTITTTGYGSLPIGVWENSIRLKWLSIGLMVFAVPAWILFFGVLASAISRRGQS